MRPPAGRFLAPRQAILREVLRRAQDRGEVRSDADLDLAGSPALPRPPVLGPATLSRVATTAATDRGRSLGAALQRQVASGQVSQDQLPGMQTLIQHDASTRGAASAFLVAALIAAAAPVITPVFLRVRHQELSTDTVHLGPA